MNAIAIKPTVMKVIPRPRKGLGTSEYCIFSRMAARPTMANAQPIPEPRRLIEMFKGKYHVCDAFGIPIYVDVSFLFLLLIFVTDFGSFTFGVAAALALAVSVILHELGHALTARVFGYKTRDITLSLLGGCASLIALPRKAWQELVTALAGPLVSFAIAGSVLMLDVFGIVIHNAWLRGVLQYTFWMNVMLGAFNLLPGFPMDGGRIFRSVMCGGSPREPGSLVLSRTAMDLTVAGIASISLSALQGL